jgi:hypothetical protein
MIAVRPDRLAPTVRCIDEGALRAEVAVFARYLTGAAVTAYQIDKYIAAHRVRVIEPTTDFDGIVYRMSRAGGIGLSLADAYTGTMRRTAVVRIKLIVTLAILECSPPSFTTLDAPDRHARSALVLQISKAVLLLTAAVVVIGPLHLWHAVSMRWR